MAQLPNTQSPVVLMDMTMSDTAAACRFDDTHTAGSLTWFWLQQQQACLPALLLLLLLFPSPPTWSTESQFHWEARPTMLEVSWQVELSLCLQMQLGGCSLCSRL